MTEQYKNFAESTLTSSMDDSQTTIDVDDPSLFPTTDSDTFRIRIDDEIIWVLLTYPSTWFLYRGHEGTTATSHTSGAPVRLVLTEGGLQDAVYQWSFKNPMQSDLDVAGWDIVSPSFGTSIIAPDIELRTTKLKSGSGTTSVAATSFLALGMIDSYCYGNESVMLGGYNNNLQGDETTGIRATVINGQGHSMYGDYSAIIGGSSHTITSGGGSYAAESSAIIAGSTNQITNGDFSAIIGGASNSVSVSSGTGYCAIVGGQANQVNAGDNSGVFGGYLNTISSGATNGNSAIIGGTSNTLTGINSAILASESCNINNGAGGTIAACAIVGAASSQITTGNYCTIIGGNSNAISNSYGSIASSLSAVYGGSYNNILSGNNCSIIGGQSNTITDYGDGFSTIINGVGNTVTAEYCVAMGNGGTASIPGEFIHSAGSTIGQYRRFLISGAGSSTIALFLPDSENLPVICGLWTFDAIIGAVKDGDGADRAGWKVEGVVIGFNGLVGTPVVTDLGEEGTADMSCAVTWSAGYLAFTITQGGTPSDIHAFGVVNIAQPYWST